MARGERVYEILKQEQYKPMPVPDQVISLYTVTNGHVDSIPVEDVVRFEQELLSFMHRDRSDLVKALGEQKEITSEIKQGLEEAIKAFKQSFVS